MSFGKLAYYQNLSIDLIQYSVTSNGHLAITADFFCLEGVVVERLDCIL